MKRSTLQDLPPEPVSHKATIQQRVQLAYGAVPHLTQLSQPGCSLAQGLGLSAGLVALAVQRLGEAACRPTDHQGP
jgi:hypothetical protein